MKSLQGVFIFTETFLQQYAKMINSIFSFSVKSFFDLCEKRQMVRYLLVIDLLATC